jgi:hypothetical protein
MAYRVRVLWELIATPLVLKGSNSSLTPRESTYRSEIPAFRSIEPCVPNRELDRPTCPCLVELLEKS